MSCLLLTLLLSLLAPAASNSLLIHPGFLHDYPIRSVSYLSPLRIQNPSLETLDISFVHRRDDVEWQSWLPAKFEVHLDVFGKNVTMIMEHNTHACHAQGTVEIVKDGVVMSKKIPNNAYIGRIVGDDEENSEAETFMARQILQNDSVFMTNGPSLARFVVDLQYFAQFIS